MKPEITLNKPHPRSYGADLPLRPLTDGQLTKITAADKAYFREHPISLVETTYAQKSDRMSKPELIEKARSLFADLNVTDETPAAGQQSIACEPGHTHEFRKQWTVGSYSHQRGETEFYRQQETGHEEHFVCKHCKLPVTVSHKKLAPTPKIPSPYEARNKREEKLDREGKLLPVVLRKWQVAA